MIIEFFQLADTTDSGTRSTKEGLECALRSDISITDCCRLTGYRPNSFHPTTHETLGEVRLLEPAYLPDGSAATRKPRSSRYVGSIL